MDPFSEMRAVVSMLADYVQTLGKNPEAKKDCVRAKALQIVREALQPKYTRLMESFEEDPETYGEVVTKHLLVQTSQEKTIADQLGDLLYQFHREESASQKIEFVDQGVSTTAGGSVIGGEVSVVKGDASSIGEIGGEFLDG